MFIDVGLRIGAKSFYDYFYQFGLMNKTGVDLPGEAGTIMHKLEGIGPVELATISFGQSFQISPLQLATTAASLINGGNRITPHIASYTVEKTNDKSVSVLDKSRIKAIEYPKPTRIVSEATSEVLQDLLEKVVSEGSGKNAAVEGFSIGGKTATSQTLPRSSNQYISSFLGFAPADNPQVLVLVVIHKPKGTYYGGMIAAPVAKELFENILPYLDLRTLEK